MNQRVWIAALLLAGCLQTSEPATTPFDPTPTHPASEFTPSDAPFAAAMAWQRCGGIGGWCSGISVMAVLTDGTFVRVEGRPWGDGDSSLACGPYSDIIERLEELGGAFDVDCPADARAMTGGTLHIDDASVLVAHLESMEPLRVPQKEQTTGCCDRVFTTVTMALDERIDHMVWEDAPPSGRATTHHEFHAIMMTLADWADAQQV